MGSRLLAIGGGVGVFGALCVALYKAQATRAATEQAVREGGRIQLRLTGYWPFSARPDEKQMEGPPVDRKGKPLHTVEDVLAGRADFVSLSGDDAAWPYGQKVLIPWLDGRTVPGRVVDTGSHFRGLGKMYRVSGAEPIDVCVASSTTSVPKVVQATIVKGDHLDKPGKAIAASQFQGQTVVVGSLELLGAVAL